MEEGGGQPQKKSWEAGEREIKLAHGSPDWGTSDCVRLLLLSSFVSLGCRGCIEG